MQNFDIIRNIVLILLIMLIAILHCLKSGSMYNVGAYHTLNAIIYIYIYIYQELCFSQKASILSHASSSKTGGAVKIRRIQFGVPNAEPDKHKSLFIILRRWDKYYSVYKLKLAYQESQLQILLLLESMRTLYHC